MGPGGCAEPGRDAGHLADEANVLPTNAQLSARFFTEREPGESWTHYRVRQQALIAEQEAARHEAIAMHLRAEAGLMRVQAGLPPSTALASFEPEMARTEAMNAQYGARWTIWFVAQGHVVEWVAGPQGGGKPLLSASDPDELARLIDAAEQVVEP